MSDHVAVVDQLVALGFSQYEARTYVGLVGKPAMTGYALSNATQVPQPKVYETLRRLEDKQAVVRIGDDPARFVAVSPEALLEQLENRFRGWLADAKQGLGGLTEAESSVDVHVFEGSRSWTAIAAVAATTIEQAYRHVYISAHSGQLSDLRTVLLDADRRGVQIDALCFGKAPLQLQHGRVLTHSSTDGVVYRHHQARHLALVADNTTALWALAPGGNDWNSISGDDPLLTSVVKGYIRHDAYVQQIYSDFREELERSYGPGLEALITRTDGLGAVADTPNGSEAPAKRVRGKRRRPA